MLRRRLQSLSSEFRLQARSCATLGKLLHLSKPQSTPVRREWSSPLVIMVCEAANRLDMEVVTKINDHRLLLLGGQAGICVCLVWVVWVLDNTLYCLKDFLI